MNEEATTELDGKRSFEERVFARFDALDNRLDNFDARIQVLEAHSYDTKPMWERALKEIIDTRVELRETTTELKFELRDFKREVTKRLDKIEIVQLQNRVDIRELEEGIEKFQPHPV